MSLISKQIEELRAYAADRKGEVSRIVSDAADTIESLSKKLSAANMERSSQYYNDGWIPVTERLPKEKEDVLLAFKQNMIVGCWENVLGDDVTWYANSGDGWMTGTEDVDNDGIPLAWMSLPSPWKGEEK